MRTLQRLLLGILFLMITLGIHPVFSYAGEEPGKDNGAKLSEDKDASPKLSDMEYDENLDKYAAADDEITDGDDDMDDEDQDEQEEFNPSDEYDPDLQAPDEALDTTSTNTNVAAESGSTEKKSN